MIKIKSVRIALLIIVALGCANDAKEQPHRAVGKWVSSDDRLALNLFPDGTGSFKARKCSWKKVDASSVKTDCERILVDNAIRVFTVVETEGGQLVGQLETFQDVVFVQASVAHAATGVLANRGNLAGKLEPTWVGNNEAVQALGGQVLIAAFHTTEHAATLRITLPDTSVVKFDAMPVGTRQIVTVKGVEYFLDLLDAGEVMGAEVSLTAIQ